MYAQVCWLQDSFYATKNLSMRMCNKRYAARCLESTSQLIQGLLANSILYTQYMNGKQCFWNTHPLVPKLLFFFQSSWFPAMTLTLTSHNNNKTKKIHAHIQKKHVPCQTQMITFETLMKSICTLLSIILKSMYGLIWCNVSV